MPRRVRIGFAHEDVDPVPRVIYTGAPPLAAVDHVLIAVTHGGGRAPSVAWVSRWILDTVNANGGGRLVWATTEQARGKR